MRTLDDGDGGDDAAEVVFRDMILLTLGALFVVVALMFPYLNPRARQAQAASTEPPGSVMVELNWPDDLDADVDLWVQAPGDVPVGYSNKGGAVMNLLRDDLGQQLDLSGRNFEVAYGRGLVPGEYVVNAHLFRNRSSAGRVPLTAVVTTKEEKDGIAQQVLASKAELVRDGQELTIFRFRLDERGRLEPDSVNSLYKSLRSGSKTS